MDSIFQSLAIFFSSSADFCSWAVENAIAQALSIYLHISAFHIAWRNASDLSPSQLYQNSEFVYENAFSLVRDVIYALVGFVATSNFSYVLSEFHKVLSA